MLVFASVANIIHNEKLQVLDIIDQLKSCFVAIVLNDRVVDVSDFWHGGLNSTFESVKSTQVAIGLPPMQPCIVCLG